MKGYKISKNYKKLWNLINNDYEIPARILFNKKNKKYDFVNIKISDNNKYMIYNRGISYGLETDKKDFLKVCKEFNIEYIIPNDTV